MLIDQVANWGFTLDHFFGQLFGREGHLFVEIFEDVQVTELLGFELHHLDQVGDLGLTYHFNWGRKRVLRVILC